MLTISRFEEATQINMGREIDGKLLCRVSAYLVGGLLIYTGCLPRRNWRTRSLLKAALDGVIK